MNEKKFLTDKEMANALSLGQSTTRKLMMTIPGARIHIGKSVRNNWEVVKEYLEEHDHIAIKSEQQLKKGWDE